MIIDIPCVILSGGKSSRMGTDKSLLPFAKYPTLIEYQYKRLKQLFKTVYISSKINKFDFKCDIIYDNSNISSPMVALYSILKHIATKKVFIITVDTPLVELDTIEELVKNADKYDLIIAKDKFRTHNLCGVFDKQLIFTIETMLNNENHKINTLIKSTTKCKILAFENSNQFVNINNKDDYKKAIDIRNNYL